VIRYAFFMQLPAGDAQLVQIMDQALAEAAQKAGSWLTCHAGCTQCCHGSFAVNTLDALRLRTGMEALRTTDPLRAKAVEERAQSWLSEHGDEFPGDHATGLLGQSEQDQERFADFANEAACPALDPTTGHCDLYAWRPMTCRVFGPPVQMEEGIACCELCFVDASEEQIAACAMPLPHELEAVLLDEVGATGETVVAFALVGQACFSKS
jgi:Fe-S-cluster containining protein